MAGMNKPLKILKCIIADDEPLAREVISRFVQRIPSLKIVAECENAVQVMTSLQQEEIDLLFLDIQMPEITGTELLRILKKPPKVIITTAYPEFALEGYELDVVDYLLKPIQFERFLKAINKVFQQTLPVYKAPDQLSERSEGGENPYLYFRTDRKIVKVMLEDIIYIEGMKNYVKIVTRSGNVITKNSMAAVEAMLSNDSFIRVHRSYIVSISKIKSFTGELIGVGQVEIPIGKLFKNEVMKLLEREQ